MDKLNKKLINIKKRLTRLEKDDKSSSGVYQYLQDELHLYLDSEYDTTDAEKFIIGSFWKKAYKKYKDGGYITNDEYISKVRFDYERIILEDKLDRFCKNSKRALDIGCGNGRYTKEFAKRFDAVVGIDLSKKQIKQNKKDNKQTNIIYLNEDFIESKNNTLGKFDFIFVGDIFMYTNDKDVEKVFASLINLLDENGILIIRESSMDVGYENYKSKNYVAYYRNKEFYKKGIFKENFFKSYKNCGYNLYDLNKYFDVFKDEKIKIENNPMKLDKVVDKFIPKTTRTSYFYLYKV
ncbi:MAG: class I SAM-dependent methyltransferase [Campylobacterales bacterium]|nr:class I SAM-dependent methyltransferase [Campylobacterales bacterium]